MVKQQHEVDLANGPPGYVVRKSRDALWKFDVRGDPPLIETGNLTGFNNLSGLNPVMALLIFSEIAGCNRPDGRGMPKPMMNDEGRMMNDRNAEDITINDRCLSLSKCCLSLSKAEMQINEKDCVRVDYYPEGTHIQLGKQGFHRAQGVIFNAVRSKDADRFKEPRFEKLTCQRAQLSDMSEQALTASREAVILKQMGFKNNEKDCVRLDYFPEGARKKLGKQGFHRAPRAIRRMMNDEWRMMNDRNAEDITKWGLKPKCSCNQDPLPEGNGKGYCHDRSCCTIEKSYPLLPIKNRDRLSALADGLGLGIRKKEKGNEK